MKNTDCRMFDFYSDCMEFFLINSLGEIPRTLLKARRKETSLEFPTFSEIAFIVSDLSEKIAGVGAFGIMFRFLSPVLSLAVLCITVKKSGDLTKRMFGA